MKPKPQDLLAHPDVTQAIKRVLRSGGVSLQELDDVVGDVQLRVLNAIGEVKVALGLLPKTAEEWKALGIVAAQHLLIDRGTKESRRAKLGNAGAVLEDPDAREGKTRRRSERDPYDQKVAMRVIDEVVEEGQMPALDHEVVRGLALGEKQSETAKRLGLPPERIRRRVVVIRASFAAKVSVLGAGALAILLYFRATPPTPGPEPLFYKEAPVAQIVDATPLEEAADLRQKAKEPCRTEKWDECRELFDAAFERDPDGERANPELEAVRERLQEEYQLEEMHAKDGPGWRERLKKQPPKTAPSGSVAPKPAP